VGEPQGAQRGKSGNAGLFRTVASRHVARQSGVNRIQIIDIEAGRKTGSAATLKKLATALQVDMDDRSMPKTSEVPIMRTSRPRSLKD
jgi:transcriptional regulator with XRE-family HTH domain